MLVDADWLFEALSFYNISFSFFVGVDLSVIIFFVYFIRYVFSLVKQQLLFDI